MKIFFFILLLTGLAGTGCRHKSRTNTITIEGSIKNLPDGWVWLTPADRWKIHLDSAFSKDGHFVMRISSDKLLEPIKVSLRYRDNTKPGSVATLTYINFLAAADGERYTTDAFYMEDHPVKIEGDLSNDPPLHILAGEQTAIMFKYQRDDFGWIDFRDPVKRKQRMEFFKTIIKQNPNSYFLLENLYRFKEQYAKEEFVDLMELFQKDLRKLPLGDSMLNYLSKRPYADQAYSPMDLTNADGKMEKFPDSLRPVNMLVFWASWCLPCRREIKVLRQVDSQFKSKGLQLISVSIDVNIQNWNVALQEEKMPWKQLRVSNDKMVTIMQQYNFTDIPFTVMIDSNGREIRRFSGYDPESGEVYHKFLEDILDLKK